MFRRTQIRAILELLHQGRSYREIAAILKVSKNTVISVEKAFQSKSLTWEDVTRLNDSELYKTFYPDRFQTNPNYAPEDFNYVHNELKKIGVNLNLLWEEYCEKCKNEGLTSCCYATYTRNYKKYVANKDYTSHVEHKPGVTCEVDWSGSHMFYFDADTKEKLPASLFVATFPYSQKTYVEATASENEATWLLCHVHMFEYFGGTPIKIVCDNLKTGINEHPKQGEIILNEAYLSLGEYYSVAIMPTGVKKPKHKASVEGSVGKIATAIIARLRNEKFNSLRDLNEGIKEALEQFNNKPFQKRNGSREIVFNTEEKPYLRQLPIIPFEVCEWTYDHTVGKDSHVPLFNGRYSVPSRLIGQKVDIKSNSSTVYIYHSRELVAQHLILPKSLKNGRRTDPSHLPYLPFEHETLESIKKKSASVGENMYIVAEHLIETSKVEEQAITSIKAILDISRTDGTFALEQACKKALEQFRTPRYVQIIEFVKKAKLAKPIKATLIKNNIHGIVRGSDYYKKESNK